MNIELYSKSIREFYCYIDESYSIERMYEETRNVLVTLSDQFQTCQFIVFKCRKNSGKAVHILEPDGKYAACFEKCFEKKPRFRFRRSRTSKVFSVFNNVTKSN